MSTEPILEPDQPRERASFKRFKHFDWLHATFVQHSFAPHTHDGYVFSVIERGVEAFTCRGALHYAPKDSLIMVNPDEVHTGYAPSASGWTYRCFYPSFGLLEAIGSELGSKSAIFFNKTVTDDTALTKQFMATHQLFSTNTSQLELDSSLHELLAAFIVRHANLNLVAQAAPIEPKAVRMAREYLEAHLTTNISLKEVAAITDLSEFAILRAFKRIHGLPPHAYVLQNRLKQAKAGLRLTKDITQVALEFGFSDQAHFTRLFKKTFGITPAVYQRG